MPQGIEVEESEEGELLYFFLLKKTSQQLSKWNYWGIIQWGIVGGMISKNEIITVKIVQKTPQTDKGN